jgi:hypothetical protein
MVGPFGGLRYVPECRWAGAGPRPPGQNVMLDSQRRSAEAGRCGRGLGPGAARRAPGRIRTTERSPTHLPRHSQVIR